MRARTFLAVVIVAATGRGASGQTTTADGVAALARGDYARAVEILKPIAEDLNATDQAAQFFLAGLYETGRGVPADALRACALYLRASSAYERPFGQEASALFGTAISRGQAFNEECQTLANVGFDNGFEPVTFFLEPGQSIELTLAAATVTYDGKSRREPMAPYPGARYLPPQHTELATGPTRSLRRHFIEQFLWLPSGRGGPWNLQWQLFEVVREELIRIDVVEPLATVAGELPPSREAFDVREYAALRVDDEGHAEWAVLKGTHASTRRIETDTERREVREAARAREAALKGVDWKKRSDVQRQPSMAYIDADGCGDFQVLGWTADRAEVLVVSVRASELGLSTEPASLDLARQPLNISVEAHVYDTPQRHFNFCTDVIINSEPGPEVWRAVAGTIAIELSPAGIRAHNPGLRRATVTLSNLVLRNSAGRTVTVSQPVRLTAIVGSIFG